MIKTKERRRPAKQGARVTDHTRAEVPPAKGDTLAAIGLWSEEDLRGRYGISPQKFGRMVANRSLHFPKPVQVAGESVWLVEAVEEWDASRAKITNPTVA